MCIFLQVFAMAQFYNILQLAMAIYYPQAVQLAAETKVSLKRLEVSLHKSLIVVNSRYHRAKCLWLFTIICIVQLNDIANYSES
jgi:CDP-diglyceride synthetase